MKEKTEDPLSFDDVPGLGPVGTKALHDEGYYTTLQIICKTPTFLKDVTGMDRDKAGAAFKFMKAKLQKAGLIGAQEISATDLLHQRKNIPRVTSGCKSIDNILGGGFEVGSITEIYGRNGSGKTQMGHTLAIMAQTPISEGGLWEEGKPRPLVVWIDTENTFRPERIISILAGKGMITKVPSKLEKKILEGKQLTKEELKEYQDIQKTQEKEAKAYLDHIEVYKATTAQQEYLFIQNSMRIIKEANIKLIIVDSGTALFRSEYLGRGNTKAKFDLLNEVVHDLKLIAENFKILVIFVNQIYNAPDLTFGQDPDVPYGGHVVGHQIPYRLKTEFSGSKYKLRIVKSPYQDQDEVKFNLTAAGPSDI